MLKSKPLILRPLLLAAMVLALGCDQPEPIVVHEVPRERSGLDRFNDAIAASKAPRGVPSETSPQGAPTRMVVAMIPRPDTTWTFKLTGPPEAVETQQETWRTFFDQLAFGESGEPEFALPEGWADGGVRQGMFSEIQTLLLGTDTPATKMEISQLSPGQQVAENANRWRGQLGLPSLGEAAEMESRTNRSGPYFLFDETGVFQGRQPPFAGGAPPRVPSQPIAAVEDVVDAPPAGWEPGPPSSIVRARYRKQTEQGEVELTVARMSAENEWATNVREWARQVDWGDMTDAEMDERTNERTVAGQPARLIRLVDPERAAARGIVAVMLTKGDSAWFIKLAGDPAAVTAAESELDAYLESLQINVD